MNLPIVSCDVVIPDSRDLDHHNKIVSVSEKILVATTNADGEEKHSRRAGPRAQ